MPRTTRQRIARMDKALDNLYAYLEGFGEEGDLSKEQEDQLEGDLHRIEVAIELARHHLGNVERLVTAMLIAKRG
jgi:hypothetical protein